MVAQEEAVVMMMKGKRTKRTRPLSPGLPALVSSGEDGGGAEKCYSDTSVTHSTEEEEDMAHCLILLAQGSNNIATTVTGSSTNRSSPQHQLLKGPGPGPVNGSYECKTCNRAFPSFQALGGHRASHKKPKLSIAVPEHHEKKSVVFSLLAEEEIGLSLQIANRSPSSASIVNNNNNNGISNGNSTSNFNSKGKVHECSICGAEFSSGQALGGHMRRHRPIGGTPTTSIPSPSQNVSIAAANSPYNNTDGNEDHRPQDKTTRNFLSLDLNMPAPEDDHHQHHQQQQQQQQHHRDSSFVFPSNGKTLVFSATSLVDCHY